MSRPESKRAIRRIKSYRLKKKYKKIAEHEQQSVLDYYKSNQKPDHIQRFEQCIKHTYNKMTNTPCLCSCTQCGNPRKLYKNRKSGKTRQEILIEQDLKDEIS